MDGGVVRHCIFVFVAVIAGIFMFIARRNYFINMPITQNETFQAERAEIICRNKGGKEGVMTAGFDQSSNFAIADPSALCPASMKF